VWLTELFGAGDAIGGALRQLWESLPIGFDIDWAPWKPEAENSEGQAKPSATGLRRQLSPHIGSQQSASKPAMEDEAPD
jgi:hypothetical protein